MIQRGRKGVASLVGVPVIHPERLDPPRTLTAEQAETWRAVVATKPAEWFGADSLPLLAAYCKAVSEHGRVSLLIDTFDTECLTSESPAALNRYEQLIRMQDRLASSMVRLATKMRLTQQSRYRADAAGVADRKAAGGTARPWHRVVEG